jgi:hypothetical protein
MRTHVTLAASIAVWLVLSGCPAQQTKDDTTEQPVTGSREGVKGTTADRVASGGGPVSPGGSTGGTTGGPTVATTEPVPAGMPEGVLRFRPALYELAKQIANKSPNGSSSTYALGAFRGPSGHESKANDIIQIILPGLIQKAANDKHRADASAAAAANRSKAYTREETQRRMDRMFSEMDKKMDDDADVPPDVMVAMGATYRIDGLVEKEEKWGWITATVVQLDNKSTAAVCKVGIVIDNAVIELCGWDSDAKPASFRGAEPDGGAVVVPTPTKEEVAEVAKNPPPPLPVAPPPPVTIAKEPVQIPPAAEIEEAGDPYLAIFAKAELKWRRGFYPWAKKLYSQLLDWDDKPRLSIVYFRLGHIAQYHGKKYGDAAALYWKSLEIWPNSAAPYNNLGVIAIRQGNRTDAQKLLKRALEIDPYLAVAHANVAWLDWELGRRAEAKSGFDRANRLSGKVALAHVGLGILAFEDGDEKTAKSELQVARSLDSKFGEVYYWLGRIEENAGKWKEAKDHYLHYEMLEPDGARSDVKVRRNECQMKIANGG